MSSDNLSTEDTRESKRLIKEEIDKYIRLVTEDFDDLIKQHNQRIDQSNALIMILQEELARVQKENEILRKTSEYRFWFSDDKTVFNLEIGETHLQATRPFDLDIDVYIEVDEDDTAFSSPSPLLSELLGENIRQRDISEMDFTITETRENGNRVAFSMCLGGYSRARIQSLACSHAPDYLNLAGLAHDSSDSDSDDGVQEYGYVSSHHAWLMLEEIFTYADGMHATKH